jgi:hypothetical protein
MMVGWMLTAVLPPVLASDIQYTSCIPKLSKVTAWPQLPKEDYREHLHPYLSNESATLEITHSYIFFDSERDIFIEVPVIILHGQ